MSTAEAPPGSGALPPDTVRVGGTDTPIGPDGLTIGRGEGCDITLQTHKASRRHARIFIGQADCWIEDLGSTNGTFVRGERVDGPTPLRNGDRVVIGDQELLLLSGERTAFGRGAYTGKPQQSRRAEVPLGSGDLSIGRDARNELVLDDPNVSRFHAVITRSANEVSLRDLASRNGTRVNGELVSRTILSPGADIAIGAYRLTFTGTSLIPRDDREALRLEARAVTIAVGDRVLLAPTTLVVEPGELVAIIGESGAGKTTLLKALAGITVPASGEVLVNGEPITSRLTDVGYVPQDDIVHRLLSVREALRFAAQLRLPPDTSAAEVDQAVGRVLGELDLVAHADKLVRTVSGGQRKRVGVAVELLSRPGVLFLDEPATGLDPGLEKRLMELLRSLSSGARPIVTITHSTKHLPLCDKVAVMARGGVLVFYGAPSDALEHFDVSDFDDIYSALDRYPPEHWLAAGASTAAPPAQSRSTSLFSRPSRQRQPAVLPQARILARRYCTLLLRDRRNLAILLGQVPILALLIAIGFSARTFAPTGSRIDATTFLFVTTITAIWLGSIAAAREIVKEKSVFLRERAVGVSVSAYLISKVAVLFVLCAAQVAILTVVLFTLRPLHEGASAYVLTFVVLLLTSLAAIGMGLLISTLARSEDQSTSFIPLVLIPLLLFGGSLIPLVGKGIGIKILSGLMVSRWSFASLGSAIHLDDSLPIVHHYGHLFAVSTLAGALLVAAFAAASLIVVSARLQAQRD
jgi:ABC-type multidrug transport system ATPase subunit/ABC-type multidrug transport system permease subunit